MIKNTLGTGSFYKIFHSNFFWKNSIETLRDIKFTLEILTIIILIVQLITELNFLILKKIQKDLLFFLLFPGKNEIVILLRELKMVFNY